MKLCFNHYEITICRYLKAMGIQKKTDGPTSGSSTPTSRPPSNNTPSSNNNNNKGITNVPSSMSQSVTGLSGFAAAAAGSAAAASGSKGSSVMNKFKL